MDKSNKYTAKQIDHVFIIDYNCSADTASKTSLLVPSKMLSTTGGNKNRSVGNMTENNVCMTKYTSARAIDLYSVSTENSYSVSGKEQSMPAKRTNSNGNIVKEKVNTPRMDWNDYHRLEVIYSFLHDLEYSYPSTCTVGAIGKSREGRDLKVLKISSSDTKNKCVWIDAGIHAREWIAPAVATYIANHIARNFNELPTSVSNKDWYFMPVVNPDGYVYSHTVDRMWRKNRAFYARQCVGVDLNRNFSIGWGGRGSSDVPTSVFYRGPAPFSEPESATIKDMLTKSGIKYTVYITLHSYGQVIVFPFSCRDELCPDYVRLLEGATVMSKAINERNSNIYKVGISRDVMYGAAGTSYDFSYGAAGIPFCYLIELRSKEHKFKLPKEEIEETGNEILDSVFALMKFIDEKYSHIK